LFAGAKIRPDRHERGVGLITISGGDCTLLCDIADQEGLPVPELSPETQKVLVESLDKPTLLGNPSTSKTCSELTRKDSIAAWKSFFRNRRSTCSACGFPT
jgi:hypothetical protein